MNKKMNDILTKFYYVAYRHMKSHNKSEISTNGRTFFNYGDDCLDFEIKLKLRTSKQVLEEIASEYEPISEIIPYFEVKDSLSTEDDCLDVYGMNFSYYFGKKDIAGDIVSKMQYALENPKASKDFAISTLRFIAKEYGVENVLPTEDDCDKN